jgi:hypothetical protein
MMLYLDSRCYIFDRKRCIPLSAPEEILWPLMLERQMEMGYVSPALQSIEKANPRSISGI